jgi:high affinity Mn2+ porin
MKRVPIHFEAGIKACGLLLILVLFQIAAFAQSQDSPSEDQATTIFNHPASSRFWLSGQVNIILQWHRSFRAKYSGENSLNSRGENATSRVLTLYTGARITNTTEVLFDLESAGGRGISDALGLAGYTNLDVVRNPTLGAKPYLARLMVRQIIPLSSESVEAERDQLHLATKLPVRRLEVRAGKFSLADFFDLNSVGSDSHLQFMNWTVDNNGGYDYAADTRGYTYAILIEYQDRRWGLRFAEALMPKVANGIKLDWNLRRARAENLEIELRRSLLPKRAGTLRLLAYVNHANMGDYREAIAAFLSGKESTPDIEAHRRQGRIKYGFGANAEQQISEQVRVFGRWGWNEGHHESFAYTEVNDTVELGADLKGSLWRRRHDKVGVALVSNGISAEHRRYLALGGHGFLLGDGALNYGRERVLETYYTLRIWRGIFASFDLQQIVNPGYNRDRGPVIVPALRMHIDF